jgi:hypothetical protein
MYSSLLLYTNNKTFICKIPKVNYIFKRHTGFKKFIEEVGKVIKNIRSVSPPRTPEKQVKVNKKKYHYVYQPSMSNRLGSTIYSHNNPNIGVPINSLIDFDLNTSLHRHRRYNKPVNFRYLIDDSLAEPVTSLSFTPEQDQHIIDKEKSNENNNNYVLSNKNQIIHASPPTTDVNTLKLVTYGTELTNTNNVLSSSLTRSSFIAKSPRILSNLSGLMSLDDNFRLKLTNESNFKVFSSFFLHISSKIIWSLFSTPLSQEEFIPRIFKCFSLIQNDLSSLDEFAQKLYMDKYISMIQHILTILCHNYRIDIKFFVAYLEKLDPRFTTYFNIDFSHYKTISVDAIIEYFIFYNNFKLLNYRILPHNVQFIDHTHFMFNKIGTDDMSVQRIQEDVKIDIFKESDSLLQTSQVHCDLIFYNINIDSQAIVSITNKIYKDVKADYRGPIKGHITIKPFLFTDRTLAQQYMNDYISTLKNKVMLHPTLDFLVRDLRDLIDIINIPKKRKSTIKDIILMFNQKVLDMSINHEYINIGINFTIAIDLDLDETFMKDIIPQLKSALENDVNDMIDINLLFPKNNKIYIDKYHEKIIKILELCMGEPMKSEILKNYKKFIEDCNK